jgi:hypothetical protein
MLPISSSMGSVPSCSMAMPAARPFIQVHMVVKIATAMTIGTQPPQWNFSMLAVSKVASITRKTDEDRNGEQPRPFPAAHRQREHQDGRDQHGAGDGDAVGGGEVGRRLEEHHQPDHARQQQPVDRRHVDLAELARRGVLDADAALRPSSADCCAIEKAPEMVACEAITVATVASATSG